MPFPAWDPFALQVVQRDLDLEISHCPGGTWDGCCCCCCRAWARLSSLPLPCFAFVTLPPLPPSRNAEPLEPGLGGHPASIELSFSLPGKHTVKSHAQQEPQTLAHSVDLGSETSNLLRTRGHRQKLISFQHDTWPAGVHPAYDVRCLSPRDFAGPACLPPACLPDESSLRR